MSKYTGGAGKQGFSLWKNRNPYKRGTVNEISVAV